MQFSVGNFLRHLKSFFTLKSLLYGRINAFKRYRYHLFPVWIIICLKKTQNLNRQGEFTLKIKMADFRPIYFLHIYYSTSFLMGYRAVLAGIGPNNS